MDDRKKTKTSKFLSFVLRHRPDAIGIELDEEGWVEVDVLLRACDKHGKRIRLHELEEVVRDNNKKRFAFSRDRKRIRASQGHSVNVDLGYEEAAPPDVLYHGTVERVMAAISEQGLKPMKRHHVHLSADIATAKDVGGRRGKPVVLKVDAKKMVQEGHCFYVSANGVWLTESVPSEFIERG